MHELKFSQVVACLEASGFRIHHASGILPRELLGEPSPRAGDCVVPSRCFATLSEEALTPPPGRPGDSFIWWIVAQRDDAPADSARVYNLLEQCYRENMAERLRVVYTLTGQLVAHRDRVLVQADTGDPPGALLYGPYSVYPEGRYAVEFALWLPGDVDGSLGWDTVLCELDVAAGPDAQVLARRTIDMRSLLRLDGTTLEFVLAQPTLLQFRCIWHGQHPLAVDAFPRLYQLHAAP